MIPSILSEGFFLVSIWKPALLLLPFIPWAWVISKVYDKHAARFHLNRTGWNLFHLCMGLAAVIVPLLLPIKGEIAFWIGLLAMTAILATSLLAYMIQANKDERVPPKFHIKLKMASLSGSDKEAKAAAKRAGNSELAMRLPDKSLLPVPEKETPQFQARVAAEEIMLQAMRSRALQADLAPTGKDQTFGISYLIDGVRQNASVMPAAQALGILDVWKAAAKLDLADRRKRQAGETTVEKGTEKRKVRVTTQGAQSGPRLTLLVDPDKAVKRKPEDMGLTEAQMAELRAMIEEAQGVVLLAAPADMGRTTTLYSIVRMHDAYTQNVQTVELEVQDSIEGVRQNLFDPAAEGPEFSTLLRSIMRRDPQVVAVAEVPDDNTLKEASKVDTDRTRVYVSMVGDSAMAAIQKWVKGVGDLSAAAAPLRGVVAHKLVRKLCVNCRQPYQPTPDMLKKLGIPAERAKQLYKKGGQVLNKSNKPEECAVCNGIGYNLQEGCFEIYRLGQAERDAIKSGNEGALRAELRKKQLPSIQQAALKKAVDGVTSIEEVLRVTAEAPPGATGPSSGSASPKPPSSKPPSSSTPSGSKPAAPAGKA